MAKKRMDASESGACTVALSGKHQFNPKRFGPRGAQTTEYQCVCGQRAPVKQAAIDALAATKAERARQREESKRLTGAKRMEANREDARQQGLV